MFGPKGTHFTLKHGLAFCLATRTTLFLALTITPDHGHRTLFVALLLRGPVISRRPIRSPCRKNDIEIHVCATDSPRPVQTHLEFSINTPSECCLIPTTNSLLIAL
jgi:hypothetical protein